MNFLPLVITFLLIFSAVSSSFMTSHMTDKTEALAYQGRFQALRHAYNEVEEHEYDRKKVTNKKVNHTESMNKSEKQPEQKPYFRIVRMGSFYGAINLAYLTEKEIDNKWLKEKTIQYLEAVYENATFIKELNNPNWARELIDFFIEKQKQNLKENKSFCPLSELCPNTALKEHYPKLIRGTNSFDPVTGRGYLPLERCITFRKKHKKPINIHFANPELLIVFFGKEIYEKIQQEEWPNGCPRKKIAGQSNYALDLKDLKKLLGHSFDERMPRIIDDRYHIRGKQNKRAFDPQTFISAQVFEEELIKSDY